ncbi:phosphoglycolate phosphatase [uncultured Jannaschia sp.]|uniref:phosphoglycolate phosphatase n=1 Tax=uncultured Jannaschia sp. TaxID=293347 RepID=UPI00262B6C31|nr:phosphoglycolate phosphatase [uncultured Jannaschia sp.]
MKDGRRTFEAIIFDLDGTLIDSAPGLHAAIGAMLAERGLPEPDLETVIGHIGRGAPTLVERSLRWAGADPADHPDAYARFRDLYGADPLSGTTVYPGAREVLATLHDAGLKLGLCTNKGEAPTRDLLATLPLGPFDAVAGGDSLPERKPDPAPLLHVAEMLGTAPQDVLYVGDSETDWETARAAEIAYAHVEGGYQRRPIADFSPYLTLERIGDLPAAIKDS